MDFTGAYSADNIGFLMKGLMITLKVACVSIVLSFVIGALAGTLVAERLPQTVLRRGFAALVAAVAVALLVDTLLLSGPPTA